MPVKRKVYSRHCHQVLAHAEAGLPWRHGGPLGTDWDYETALDLDSAGSQQSVRGESSTPGPLIMTHDTIPSKLQQ